MSVFYSAGADDATASLGTFFNAIKALFPSGVSWQIPASGDSLTAETGILSGSWSGGTGATVAATGAVTYAAGTGVCIRWYTNTIRSTRKFIGRTYMVPLISSTYDSDGTITAGNVTILQNAATALVTAAKCGVWGRPLDVGHTNGIYAPFTGALCVDKVTSLKTRRS